LLGVRRYPFAVENDWCRGTAEIACFDHYLALEGKPITRAMAEQRMP